MYFFSQYIPSSFIYTAACTSKETANICKKINVQISAIMKTATLTDTTNTQIPNQYTLIICCTVNYTSVNDPHKYKVVKLVNCLLVKFNNRKSPSPATVKPQLKTPYYRGLTLLVK